jgi:hypothetical protein
MEDTNKSKKINWAIIAPIILAIIVAIIFIYLDYLKPGDNPNLPNNSTSEEYKPEPISLKNNPRRTEELKDPSRYGCASPATIEPITTKSPDTIWNIPKDGNANVISLGKYKIKNPARTILDITKLWLYFLSDKLSTREDKVYALEKSYVSKMTLVVNGYEQEIKLGGTEYMLIELPDYPLGDIYPYDRETFLEFEILIELKCSNIQNGICLSNENKSLKFLDGADITSMFKIFALGCQEFDKDIIIDAVFSY